MFKTQSIKSYLVFVLLGIAALSSSCSTTNSVSNSSPVEVTVDGLELVPDSKVDRAYLKPDADFSNYNSFMIDIAEVKFEKNWERNIRQEAVYTFGIKDREKIKIIEDLSELLHETFTSELEKNSQFKVVDEAGERVLTLNVSIIDLYINAPDLQRNVMSRTYVTNAGSMTLIGELVDSTSGEVLARFSDSRKAREEFPMRLSSSVYNRQQARQMFRHWARLLREGVEEMQATDN